MITGKEIFGAVNNYSVGNPSAWHNVLPGMANVFAAPFWWLISLIIAVFIVGVWIYTSFAYMDIARKLHFKSPWLAWIPFARGAMILQLGDFKWGWVFLWSPLVLLPLTLVNWGVGAFAVLLALSGTIAFTVLCYISHWRFFEKRNYYGWLALVSLVGLFATYLSCLAAIAFLIILGFVAWKDVRRSSGRRRQNSSRRRK